MAVIGRLDEQVDEVLIRPASRRDRAGDADGPPRRRGEELTRTPPPEDSKSPARGGDDDAGSHPRQELPVWLL